MNLLDYDIKKKDFGLYKTKIMVDFNIRITNNNGDSDLLKSICYEYTIVRKGILKYLIYNIEEKRNEMKHFEDSIGIIHTEL